MSFIEPTTTTGLELLDWIAMLNNSCIYLTDPSTWENCLLWDFDYISIQSTNALGGAVENFLTSTLLLFTPRFYKKLADWLETELALPWIYIAVTKVADSWSRIFTLNSSSI